MGVLLSLAGGSRSLDCFSQVAAPPDAVTCLIKGCLEGYLDEVADVSICIPFEPYIGSNGLYHGPKVYRARSRCLQGPCQK